MTRWWKSVRAEFSTIDAGVDHRLFISFALDVVRTLRFLATGISARVSSQFEI